MGCTTAGVYSLGCKVNFYETEFYAQELTKMGLSVQAFHQPCDLYIINTCTVTAESDRKCLQTVRRAIQTNPNAWIIVTGCLAQIDAKRIATLPGVDAVFGNTQKLQVLSFVQDILRGARQKSAQPQVTVCPFPEQPIFEPMQLLRTEHTRATVKIEDGCNSHCAYCIISTARGPARSKQQADILREVTALARAGYQEVVLTGIELASYDGDLPELLQSISNIPGIARIRLGSLDPAYITPARIIRMAQVPKLAPHFHISLQSGATATLNRMRRKYNRDMALRHIQCLKDHFPEAQLFADVIVGFPGETEADFRETVDFVQQVKFFHLHIFPYSKRAGTEAAAMDGQIPQAIKKQRAAKLAAIQQEIQREILENIVKKATPLPVLFETESNGAAIGHTHHFIEVEVQGLSHVRGQILSVMPVAVNGERLVTVLSDSPQPHYITES